MKCSIDIGRKIRSSPIRKEFHPNQIEFTAEKLFSLFVPGGQRASEWTHFVECGDQWIHSSDESSDHRDDRTSRKCSFVDRIEHRQFFCSNECDGRCKRRTKRILLRRHRHVDTTIRCSMRWRRIQSIGSPRLQCLFASSKRNSPSLTLILVNEGEREDLLNWFVDGLPSIASPPSPLLFSRWKRFDEEKIFHRCETSSTFVSFVLLSSNSMDQQSTPSDFIDLRLLNLFSFVHWQISRKQRRWKLARFSGLIDSIVWKGIHPAIRTIFEEMTNTFPRLILVEEEEKEKDTNSFAASRWAGSAEEIFLVLRPAPFEIEEIHLDNVDGKEFETKIEDTIPQSKHMDMFQGIELFISIKDKSVGQMSLAKEIHRNESLCFSIGLFNFTELCRANVRGFDRNISFDHRAFSIKSNLTRGNNEFVHFRSNVELDRRIEEFPLQSASI